MTKKKALKKELKSIVVVQYEQSFDLTDASSITEAVTDALDVLRQYGGARVVGSYTTKDDKEFQDKALGSITIESPITLQFDK